MRMDGAQLPALACGGGGGGGARINLVIAPEDKEEGGRGQCAEGRGVEGGGRKGNDVGDENGTGIPKIDHPPRVDGHKTLPVGRKRDGAEVDGALGGGGLVA